MVWADLHLICPRALPGPIQTQLALGLSCRLMHGARLAQGIGGLHPGVRVCALTHFSLYTCLPAVGQQLLQQVRTAQL